MKTKDLEVFQANKFIESRQSYGVNEKRLLSTLISFVKPTDTEIIEYELSIKEWAKILGISPKGLYGVADEITTALMMKIVAIKDPVALKFEKWHVLDTARYDEGVLTLRLDKRMNDIFVQLKASKNYTHYELAEFVSLTSTHAQRVYELLKQYQHSTHRKRTLEISELKMMLGIEDKYPQFKEFKRKVLDVAFKQIEEKTTLRYKWRGIKRGRSYHKIEFYEIHISGKDSPTELQEKAFLQNYVGEDIYHEELNTYLTIVKIAKNKDKTYTVVAKFDNCSYSYKNLETLQSSIAKAQAEKSLI